MSASVPELPRLSFARCASQGSRAPPPGALPRFVTPPVHHGAGGAATEAASSMRSGRAPNLDRLGASPVNQLALTRELPALLESPSRPSREHSTPQRGSSHSRSVSRQLTCSSDFSEGGRGMASTAQDIENLKKQVVRLTQQRKDRDSYIKDLLADQEASRRRHDSELVWNTARSQREVGERLAAAQREHDLALDERCRAHAAALAQQAWQHELELGELRKVLRCEGERRLAVKLSEVAAQYRERISGMAVDMEAMERLLVDHICSLESILPDGAKDATVSTLKSSKDPTEGYHTKTGLLCGSECEPSWQEQSQSLEPEPEEGHASLMSEDCKPGSQAPAGVLLGSACGGCSDQLEQIFAEQALAEQLTARAAEAAALALSSTRSALERALAVGLQVAEARRGADHTSALVATESLKSEEALPEPGEDAEGLQQHLQNCRERLVQAEAFAAEVVEQAKSLRLERKERGLGQMKLELSRLQRQVFQTWQAEASSRRLDQSHKQEMAALQMRRRELQQGHFRSAEELRGSYAVHLAFFAWASYAASIRREQKLDAQVAAAKAEQAAEHADAQGDLRILSRRARDRAYCVVQRQLERQMAAGLHRWAVAVREAKREAAHRHRILALEAESSAELYRLRNEGKRAAVELRRQRRAHGVAAVHASLDRRLQGVLHAWSQISREARREVVYQRQLDIAAAESAAGCAVLRMENRRSQLDLKCQRRMQAVKAVTATLRHWRHAVLCAWSGVAAEARNESCYLQQLGSAAAQAAAAAAEARRRRLEVDRWQQTLADEASRGWSRQLTQVCLEAWKVELAAASRAASELRHATEMSAELRLLSLRWGGSAVVRGASGAEKALLLKLFFTSWCRSATGRLLQEKNQQQAKLTEELALQAAELEARHAAMVRQHTEATRALLAETEACHAEAMRSEAAAALAQLTLLRGEHAEEIRKQAESLKEQLVSAEARHEAALKALEQGAEARHAAKLHALTSAAEVHLSEVEASHAGKLRAQAEEVSKWKAEVFRLAKQAEERRAAEVLPRPLESGEG
eukprot:TRINITY_DN21894_c0_g1_i1.p1 TRINITY_DN21894_c0_g1~~TRINITY_DN21894_c0_g1_i1.p1  ORF type:complete len:1042 (-),score=241.74 TRINITY_DN21894_c0_g1_i1:77-3202(-)